jgi:hypothetical protein
VLHEGTGEYQEEAKPIGITTIPEGRVNPFSIAVRVKRYEQPEANNPKEVDDDKKIRE